MSRSRLGRPPGPPPVAPPSVEIGMGPAAVALAFLDLITAIAEDPKQARNLAHTDFLKQVPIKLKHEAEMWERLQQDIERLRNEKAALVVSGKEALTRAKTEAADELQRVLQEKAAVELDLKDVKASLREAQAKEDFLKKANLDVQLRLEETTREGRLKEQALTALLEGQKIQMSSLEKELAEAHDSHATGSSAKAEETEKTRRKLEEALARSAQLEVELADSKATAVRHESSLEASASRVKSLEKQLTEARDSLIDGSRAKAEETDKARQKLEDAMARCTQLEEELADSKATAVRHESSLEASANKVKSLEKQLTEARDSLAEGSRVKAEEADKARQKLEDAMARCTQLEEELADTKATAVRHESSFEASATRVKSLERQLSEARDSLAAGSSAKDQEGEETRRELNDARARCAQLEETLAETKATAARHESSLEASTTKLKSLEKQLAEARDSMAAGSSAKEKEVAETRKELQDARAKCSQLEEALAEAKANAVRQESSLEASATKLKSLEKQLAEARDSMTVGSNAKEKEVAETRKELQAARAKCSQLEEALAETKATAARHEISLEASATKLKSLEKQLAEARDSLTAGSSAKEKEGEEKRKELVDARARCTKLEEELAESRASSARREVSLQEELKTIQTKLSAAEVELSTATDSLQHSNHRQDVLREEITRLGVLNQKLATELEGLKAEHERQSGRHGSDVEQLEGKLKERDAQLEQLTSKVQEVEGEREALEQELEQKGSELEALETRAQEAETEAARQLQGKEDEIVALRAEVRSLTEQLHGVASRQGGEQDNMRAELLQKSTNLKILQTQVDALRQENVALRASESDLQQKVSGVKLLQAQVESLKKENAALQEEEAELATRLRILEEHAKSMPSMEDNNLYSPTDMTVMGPHSGLVLVIETGAYRTRFGVIDMLSGGALRNDEIISVPSVIARPHKPNADLMSVVRNAGMQAGAMYNKFRDQGIFVGKDAWYCTFDHPDPVLRSSLKVESPFRRGTLERPGDLKELWTYVFETLQLDPSEVAVLMTYKPAITSADKEKMVSILFEECFVTRARFVNEAYLLSNAASAPTCLIVDIGEDTVRVVPVYEQLVVDGAIKTAPLGGVDLTRYMGDMLLSCKDEQYSSLVPRKQLEVARRVKEKHAYVARDFDEQVAKMGKFVREKVDVSRAMRPQGESQPTLAAPQHPDELVVHDHMLQDGRDVVFAIGRERFHCPELLFRPDLYSESEATKSLADLIIDSLKSVDYDFWEDLLRNVVVAGHTSLIPGLLERLTLELKKRLPQKWTQYLHVVAAEKRLSEEDDCSAVWQGAALMASSVSEDDWLTSEVYQILTARGAASEIKYWA